ncbi:cobyrinate a,c-diamide synthase [Haloimpatiens sp. FM7330]|uniref:cobyrinate a,c-diamide synthase n=1 Tax=Haloimpatiens sp. FM7330 TaxID=3298610 RepID=UPI00362F1F1D
MKGIVVSSNKSGGGKTTITLGLMKALIKKGIDVQGYKVGPDYIDPAFHSEITGKRSRNLDIFLMGEEGIKASFSRGKGEVAIIEGVMGLYDGKGIDTRYSTAHVAKILNLPIVLVISPKAQVATLCAEINGMVNFEDVNIAGVILNNVSESYYKLLKASIENNCNIKVFGYVPKNEKLVLGSRHLGLIQSSEINDIKERIEVCANLIEKYVDLDSLVKCMGNTKEYYDNFHVKNRGLRTAIAMDKAFSFYYAENIEMLNELGDVTYFSPLKDKKLPDNIDFLYIGGGYPEVFIDELSNNKDMLCDIREKLNKGLKCYAECGGLMYLTKGFIQNVDKLQLQDKVDVKEKVQYLENNNSKKELVGFLNGYCYMTNRLQRFGYAEIEVQSKNSMVSEGSKINCHEFHKSCVQCNEKKIYKLTKTTYNNEQKQWTCGYTKNNTLAAYAHVHFFGNMDFFINSILQGSKSKL